MSGKRNPVESKHPTNCGVQPSFRALNSPNHCRAPTFPGPDLAGKAGHSSANRLASCPPSSIWWGKEKGVRHCKSSDATDIMEPCLLGDKPEPGCLPRTQPQQELLSTSLKNPHWPDGETEAGKDEARYSPTLSWCEGQLGWNPSLSETPHHTLLLERAQRGCAECWGLWVGKGRSE